MLAEKDYLYEVETEVSDFNEDNILKPYAYQNLFAKLAEMHLNKISLNVDTTMKYNLAWALMSMSFELVKPVEGCIKLYANTWYSKRQGPFFRRELVFKNEAGELMFHGSTFSVLLDIEKRTVYRKKELPFPISEPIEEFAIEAVPSFKAEPEYKSSEQRKVYNSYIDCLGHVNNCRYGEFAYDSFTDDERMQLFKLRRMDINFISELRNNDTFTVSKAYDDKKIFVRGYNDVKDTVSFEIMFKFD